MIRLTQVTYLCWGVVHSSTSNVFHVGPACNISGDGDVCSFNFYILYAILLIQIVPSYFGYKISNDLNSKTLDAETECL